jgi:hypothetical protein
MGAPSRAHYFTLIAQRLPLAHFNFDTPREPLRARPVKYLLPDGAYHDLRRDLLQNGIAHEPEKLE